MIQKKKVFLVRTCNTVVKNKTPAALGVKNPISAVGVVSGWGNTHIWSPISTHTAPWASCSSRPGKVCRTRLKLFGYKWVQTHLQGWFPFHMCPGQWRHRAIKMELVKAGRKTHFHLVSNYFLIFLPPQLTWKFPIHPTQNTGISSLSSPNKTQLEWSESTISWCKK